jgi:hypothetical protein
MLLLEILGGWVIGSCTVGPLLAWVFFHPVGRRAQDRVMPDRYEVNTVVCLGSRDVGRIRSDRIHLHSQPSSETGLEAREDDMLTSFAMETAHR